MKSEFAVKSIRFGSNCTLASNNKHNYKKGMNSKGKFLKEALAIDC